MKRALLVEDNPDNCDLIIAFLDDLYDLHIFNEGFSALKFLESLQLSSQNYPDILLFDISLPEMDGVDLLKRVRSMNIPYIPAIAMTSHAMKGDKERFLAQGFDAYISKPLDDELLITLIEEALDDES